MGADRIAAANDGMTRERNIEAQSAFASTLVVDVEKAPQSKEVPTDRPHTNVYGSTINTPTSVAGSDAVYAAKAALLNQALMDMGMGLYQWLLFIITSVGWFLDSVCLHMNSAKVKKHLLISTVLVDVLHGHRPLQRQ